MDQNYIGIEGLEYPANGSKLFQEDFIKEQQAIGKEIVARGMDFISNGILHGFEVTPSSTGNVSVSPGVAYDSSGRRMEFDGIENFQLPDPWYGAIVAQHQWIEEPYTPEGDYQQKIMRRHNTNIVLYSLEYGQEYNEQPNEIILAYGFRSNTYVYILDKRVFCKNKMPFSSCQLPCDNTVEKYDVVTMKNGELTKAVFLNLLHSFTINVNGSNLDIAFFDIDKCIIAYSDSDNNNYGTAILCNVNDGKIVPYYKLVFKTSGVSNIKIIIPGSGYKDCIIFYKDAGNNSYLTATYLVIKDTIISVKDTKTVLTSSVGEYRACIDGVVIKKSDNSLIYKSVNVGSGLLSIGSEVLIDSSVVYLHNVVYLNGKKIIIYDKNGITARIYDGTLGDPYSIPVFKSIIPISNSQLIMLYDSSYIALISINGYEITISEAININIGSYYILLPLSNKYFFCAGMGSYHYIIKLNLDDLTLLKKVSFTFNYNFYNKSIIYIHNNMIFTFDTDYNPKLLSFQFNSKFDGFVINEYNNYANFIGFVPNTICPNPIEADNVYINFGLFDDEPAGPVFNSLTQPKNYLVGKAIDENNIQMLCLEF